MVPSGAQSNRTQQSSSGLQSNKSMPARGQNLGHGVISVPDIETPIILLSNDNRTVEVVVKQPESRTLKCGECQTTVFTNTDAQQRAKINLRAHLTETHRYEIVDTVSQCRECGERQPEGTRRNHTTWAENHWKQNHNYVKIIHAPMEGGYCCGWCGMAFRSNTPLVHHVRKCENSSIEERMAWKDKQLTETQRMAIIEKYTLKMPRGKHNYKYDCLNHESGVVSLLNDTIVNGFLEANATNDRFAVADSLWFNQWDNSLPLIKTLMQDRVMIMPICMNNHWSLMVISQIKGICTYFDPKQGPMPNIIVENMQKLSILCESPKRSFPIQTDNHNCGIHVCILGLCISRELPTVYSEKTVKLFRQHLKRAIETAPIPTTSARIPKRKGDASQKAIPERKARVENLPQKVPQQKEWSVNDDISEKAMKSWVAPSKQTSKPSPIEAKTDSVIEDMPTVQNTSQSLPHIPVTKHPIPTKATENGFKGKVAKRVSDEDLTTGQGAILSWSKLQFGSYESNGKRFDRLEWIAETLAEAGQRLGNGKMEELDKVLKRNPPPDREPGETPTQTKKIRNTRSEGGINFDDQPNMISLYKKNRTATFTAIMGKEDKRCTILIDKVEKHFAASTKATETSQSVMDGLAKSLGKRETPTSFLNDFTSQDVQTVFDNMSETAPGPDGLKYSAVKTMEPTLWALTKLYNECKRHQMIPAIWKEAEVVLIYKDGDENDPSNWRPISLMRTIYKVYSSLWNKRIKRIPNIISKVQKGFTDVEGCAEHISVLRTAIDNAARFNGEIAVAWLDLANAFGSVPHELLAHSLSSFGFPKEFVNIISDIYTDSTMRVVTETVETRPIKLHAGVKQGDPLSPTLFNIALEYIIRNHLKKAKGHSVFGHKLRLLAFADDLAIICDNARQLQRELTALDADATSVSLMFKPKKCATLIIFKGKTNPNLTVELKGAKLRALQSSDTYKYLGVQLGANNRMQINSLMETMTSQMEKLTASKLAHWQKLDALKCFILTKISYLIANSTPEIAQIRELNVSVIRNAKKMHNIAVCGPREYVNLAIGLGGIGVPCLVKTALMATVTTLLKRLWSDDNLVSDLLWKFLVYFAERELDQRNLSKEQALHVLNEDHHRANGHLTVFNRCQLAVFHMTKSKEATIESMRFVMDSGDIALEIQATPLSKPITLVKKDAKSINAKLNQILSEGLLYKFIGKNTIPAKIMEVVSKQPGNNQFTRNGGKLSLASHSFIHQARCGPTHIKANMMDIAQKKDTSCRRCGYPTESLLHVLNTCPFQLESGITTRHDGVIKIAMHEIKKGTKKDYELRIDMQTPIQQGSQRPDIVLISRAHMEIVICDVTCPFENGEAAMIAAHEHKITKYTHILDGYKAQGYKGGIYPLVIGSLGSWRKENNETLKQLGIQRNAMDKIAKVMCSSVIESSKDIYWKHIHGESYECIPRQFAVAEVYEYTETNESEPTKESLEQLENSLQLPLYRWDQQL